MTDTLSIKTKLSFGVGATAETLSLYSYAALITLYYNQILGLEIWMAGLAPTLAIFFDAISDPFMGSFSDRFKSKKWGRRHPFMLVSPVPIAISFWCVFNPPESLHGWALFTWLTCWAICLRTCMTVYHVPHLALGGELATDYTERSKVMSYNNLFGWFGGRGFFLINTFIFFASGAAYANGYLNADAYFPFSTAMAFVIVIVLFSSAWLTRDRIPFLPQPADDQPAFKPIDFYKDLLIAFSNRNYLFLMLAYFVLSLMLGVRAGLSTYMNIYYWELPSEQFATLIFIAGIIGYISAFTVAARLHQRFDKKPIIVITAVTLSIFPAMPVILRMMGYFPENGTMELFYALGFFDCLGSFSGSVLYISVMSSLADVADEIQLQKGLRQEGILYSARTFFAKLDNSIGHGIATLALFLISFPKKAIPGEVDAEVIVWLGIIDSPMTVVAGLIAACLYSRYRINRTSYEETRAALLSAQPR